jgi:chitinase
MQPVDASSLTVSWDGTCGPEKKTRCATGCCSQYGNCGTSTEHCSGACQHAFGTGCTDADVAGSWQLAAAHGVTDEEAGGQYYFDAQNRLFWTWDTPALICRKFDEIVRKYKLGGAMAWSLGEDSNDWSHIKQMAKELKNGGYAQSAYQSLSMQNASSPAVAGAVESPSTDDYESGPASSISPQDDTPVTSTYRSSSAVPPTPYNIVFVDSSANGPNSAVDATPGSPPDYTVNHGQQETASTPQENVPIAPVQSASAFTNDDQPFSPEYRVIIASMNGASLASSALDTAPPVPINPAPPVPTVDTPAVPTGDAVWDAPPPPPSDDDVPPAPTAVSGTGIKSWLGRACRLRTKKREDRSKAKERQERGREVRRSARGRRGDGYGKGGM